MKIALIAPSYAGKTVFLTGLYARLTQQLSRSDYGIDFAIADKKLDSDLGKRFTALCDKNDFGTGTTEMNVYPMVMTTRDAGGNKKQMSVEIVDFPGGHLYEREDTDAEEVDRTIQQLSECDGFIVLMDGKKVIDGITGDPMALQNAMKARYIQDVLEKALERRNQRLDDEVEGKSPTKKTKGWWSKAFGNDSSLAEPNSYAFGFGPTPVVFALTKGDEIDQWLEQGDNPKLLRKGVKGQFEVSANKLGSRSAREGDVSRFIRAHFDQIIEDESVCSLRTAVTVYNKAEKRVQLTNLETLFQFVVFVGLTNACAEHESRKRGWTEERKKDKQTFEGTTADYNRAQRALESYVASGWWNRTKAFWSGNGKRGYSDNRDIQHSRLKSAGNELDSSTLSVRQAQDNYETSQLFLKRIMSADFIYRLTHGAKKHAFYHQGLPIDQLKEEDWWKEKCAEGKPRGARSKPEPRAA